MDVKERVDYLRCEKCNSKHLIASFKYITCLICGYEKLREETTWELDLGDYDLEDIEIKQNDD